MGRGATRKSSNARSGSKGARRQWKVGSEENSQERDLQSDKKQYHNPVSGSKF